jgi:hypothetical protein
MLLAERAPVQSGGFLSRSELAVEAPNTASSMTVVHAEASNGPKWQEVLLLACVCYAVYVGMVALQNNYVVIIRGFGDNQPYISIAAGIRHWDFSHIRAWQFWGLPYAMVVFSFLTHSSFLTALMFCSIAGSLAAVMLSHRLWGGWVAGFFAVTSREWMERSLLGGAEPLFMLFVFGAFLAARKERWLLASLLAALSATVRPMGVFALIGIGLVLLYRKNYKSLAAAVVIGVSIGALYIIPIRIWRGSALANVSGYGAADGSGGQALGYPVVALIRTMLFSQPTKLNLARTILWIGFVLLAVGLAIWNRHTRETLRKYPVELAFAAFYTALLFTYNSQWAWMAFPRYAIPVVPFLILVFLPWIPKNRALLWAYGIFSAVLSAVETNGFVETIHAIRHTL